MAIFGKKKIEDLEKQLAELKRTLSEEQKVKNELNKFIEQLKRELAEANKKHAATREEHAKIEQEKQKIMHEFQVIKAIFEDEKNKYKRVAELLHGIRVAEGKSEELLKELLISENNMASLVQKAKIAAVYVMRLFENLEYEKIKAAGFQHGPPREVEKYEDRSKVVEELKKSLPRCLKSIYAIYKNLNELEKLVGAEKLRLDTLGKYDKYVNTLFARNEYILKNSGPRVKIDTDLITAIKQNSLTENDLIIINNKIHQTIEFILKELIELKNSSGWIKQQIEALEHYGQKSSFISIKGLEERINKLSKIIETEINKNEKLVDDLIIRNKDLTQVIKDRLGIVINQEINVSKAVEKMAKRELGKRRK